MSTVLQTILNSMNLMMGVSILALPRAFALSGWLSAILMMLIIGYISSITARLIASCQVIKLRQTGKALLTYGDIGEEAFGIRGRIFIQSLFTLELFTATVALHLLIVHSCRLLFELDESYEILIKIVTWSILTISTWPKSLSILSYGSFLGVLCLINLMFVIIMDGLIKSDAPGSIRTPETTYVLPSSILSVPSSYGIIMAGFAGHACYPGFFASMKMPQRFGFSMKVAFSFATGLYLVVGTLGYLMFGEDVCKMVSENLNHESYPRIMYFITVFLLVINPSTKYPLTLYPILLDLESSLYKYWPFRTSRSSSDDTCEETQDEFDNEEYSETDSLITKFSGKKLEFEKLYQKSSDNVALMEEPTAIYRIVLRSFVSFLVLCVSVLFPHFDRVLSLLGSLCATTSSILFPIICWLAICGRRYNAHMEDEELTGTNSDECANLSSTSLLTKSDIDDWTHLTKFKKNFLISIFVVFFILAVTGTISALLPEQV